MAIYRANQLAMVRAPLLPVDAWRTPTASLLGDPRVRFAITVASPALLDSSIEQEKPKRRLQRERALRRYLVRMSTRPTPFGAFAGVAFVPIGEGALATIRPAAAEAIARPDSQWLHEFARAIVTGDTDPRREILWNPLAHDSSTRVALDGAGGGETVQIRRTALVEEIRRAALEPTTPLALGALLERDSPGRSADGLDRVIRQLEHLGFLTPVVSPRLLTASAARSLSRDLAGTGTALDSTAARTLDGLDSELARVRLRDVASVVRARSAMDGALPGYAGKDSIQVDLRHSVSGALPPEVAEEAMSTLDFLDAVCSGAGDGAREFESYLESYRLRFVEKYGVNTAIPVTDLLAPHIGLGAPAHYSSDAPAAQIDSRPAIITEYERALLDLLTEYYSSAARELVIDQAAERRLRSAAPTTPPHRPHYPSIDVFLQLAASRTEEGSIAGDWRVALNRHAVSGGLSAFGRFLYLATDNEVEQLAAVARARETAALPAEVAEASFVPSVTRTANVGTRVPLHPLQVGADASRPEPPVERVDIGDVYVWADYRRFHVVSRGRDRELDVVDNTVLNPAVSPHAVRLLTDITRARYRPIGGFSWGPFEDSQHLPRVVRGRTVLRSAAWTLLATALEPALDRFEAVQAWRTRWNVPSLVYVIDEDNRLVTDLTDRADVDSVLAGVDRIGLARFEEIYPDENGAWLQDADGHRFAAEIVMTGVHAATSVPSSEESRPPSRRCVFRSGAELVAVAGEWTYLRLYVPESNQNELLARSVHPLIGALLDSGDADRWFFIRYRDDASHVRLRVRSPLGRESLGRTRLLDAAAGWLAAGVISRYELDVFAPEVGRYGGDAVYDSVERAFEAMSELTVALFNAPADGAGTSMEIATIVLLDLLYRAAGFDLGERVERNPLGRDGDQRRSAAAAAIYRPARAELLDLLRSPEHLAGTDTRVASAVDALEQAVGNASDRAARAADRGDLIGDWHDVVESMAHMLVNRNFPPDREREAAIYGAWRLALVSLRGELAARVRARG